MKTYVFVYEFRGTEYGFTMEADDIDEAIAHVKEMGLSICAGEAGKDVPVVITPDELEGYLLPGGVH